MQCSQAQLLAGFGGAGFGPPSKPLGLRPPPFGIGRGQPQPLLARVLEEGADAGVGVGATAVLSPSALQAATPPPVQRLQRTAVTPLTATPAQQLLQQHGGGGGSPTLYELPPLQSPLPPPMRPSGPLVYGGLSRSDTADSYTSQVLVRRHDKDA